MTPDPKTVIAARAAQELHPGEIVNLGIGIPNLIPGHLGADTEIFLHTENGLLGVGPRPTDEDLDPDLVDAAKRPITALPGASYFDSASSFAMLVALGREEELAMHVRAALRVGLTSDEIKEVLLHSAIYCGVPAANGAFAVAQRVLDEVEPT